MNIITYSPALSLLYVFILLLISIGIDLKSFNRIQRFLFPSAIILLGISNHLLRELVGYAAYGKLLFFCMHLPTFFLFLYFGKRGVIKTAFMIFTATVFTAPTVLIGNFVRHILFKDSPRALLLSNVISYVLMLLLVYFVFRRGFQYLLTYGDNRLFLCFSCFPLIFYIYVFMGVNLDFSSLSSPAGYVVRSLPTVEVFLFYFLLPLIYKSLDEKQTLQSVQTAMQQKIMSTESQLALLNKTNMQMAVYRHDMRHHLLMLDGLLCSSKTEQAQKYVQTIMADLDSITLKKFCANDTINLLCSSYDSTAKRLNIQLNINALLPQNLPISDTELCAVVSNGLENALLAASQPNVSYKWADFSCEVKQNKLLIQIQNTYSGHIAMHNGLPISNNVGHGYGCHSIQTIIQRNGGICSFNAENGMFTLRIVLPLPEDYDKQPPNADNA